MNALFRSTLKIFTKSSIVFKSHYFSLGKHNMIKKLSGTTIIYTARPLAERFTFSCTG